MVLETIVNENNKTINQILQENFEFSNRLFSKLLRNKRVKVDDKITDTRKIAKIGEKITIDLDYEEENSNIISKKIKLDIVYEDEGLLVINKPEGIAVHPSILHYEDSLASGVKYYFEQNGIYKKIRPVNRLDLNTSGLIVFAKNEYIQENLIRQMERNTFTKEYLAIVQGTLENEKGVIELPIARKEKSIIERCVSENGQKAITEYEVVKKLNGYSLIKCRLLTGRTHQIRVHMAYIGHPLLGDTLYGEKSDLINRQALHSFKISFIHPITKKEIQLTSDIPKDFMKIL